MNPNNPNQPQSQPPAGSTGQAGSPPEAPPAVPTSYQYQTQTPVNAQSTAGQAAVVQAGTGGQTPPKPQSASNPNSTQNLLHIAEIRDGIVIMNDGSYRAIVMVKSINFDLMSPDERDAVEYAYQGFLNSLYFPVQIFIRSLKVDLRPYLERLDKIRQEHENMLLALLMEDYLAFIDQLASQTNIMDKKFYIVIPYFSRVDAQKALTQSKNFLSGLKGLFGNKEQHVVINEQELNDAKDELRNRVQAVLEGLRQCNIPGLPLDTQELIELYYDTYNPDTATRQQLKDFDEMTAPVVTKGVGQAPQPNLERQLQ